MNEFILFSVLTFTYIIFLLIIYKYNEHRNSLAVLFVILSIIFYTPSVYYTVLGGDAYRIFDSGSYLQYMFFSILLFVIIGFLLVLKNKIPMNKDLVFKNKSNIFVHLYIGLIATITLIYIIIFIDRFPLVHLVFSGERIERPDMSGSIPYYFTFSTFIFFILPAYFFYYYEKVVKDKRTKIIISIAFMVTCFLLLIGGNKGVLVYFFIFIWLFIFRMRVNFKLILMVIAAFYAFTFITNREIMSGVRRFFITQGAALVARFDMMKNDFDFNFSEINSQVFEYMYGFSGGSGPSFFVGDLLVIYGFILGTCIMVIILALLFFTSKIIDIYFGHRLFMLWSFTAVIYIVGMGGIDFPALCRVFAIMLNASIIVYLENTQFIYKIFKRKKLGKI